MSTNYHNAIATGAAANASTFNDPLGDLDAAIAAEAVARNVAVNEVDDRISDLIFESETSSSETVDARATYTVLRDRLDDLGYRSNVLLVDAAFSTNSSAKRFATISLAMAAASPGSIIMVAPGIYTENVTFSGNGIRLVGSGQPYYDTATGRLLGGTIIRGRIAMGAYVGTTVIDLGVDTYDGTTGVDCIGASNTTSYADRTYRNLTLLGKGSADLAHGFYSLGDGANIDNCRIYHCYHGIAVHGSYQNISNCWMYYCGGTALILKAKNNSGTDWNVHHINVTNIQMIGDPASTAVRSGPLAIQAEDSLSARYINITNVNAKYCVNGVVHVVLSDVTGTISDVTFNNIHSDNNLDLAGVGDYRIVTGSNIKFRGCHSTNRNGYGFLIASVNTVTSVYVFDCGGDSTGNGLYSGAFDILELNNLRGVKPQIVAIASDTITVTSTAIWVDTEGAAATDDLATINGGLDGMEIIINTVSSSRDVTIKHNTGNIQCGSDRLLSSNRDMIKLKYLLSANAWQMVSFADNL